jgi:hypothetical protein
VSKRLKLQASLKRNFSWRDNHGKNINFCLLKKLGAGVSKKIIQHCVSPKWQVVDKMVNTKNVPLGMTTLQKSLTFLFKKKLA